MSTAQYLNCLFQHYDWEVDDLLEVRLLGEKGTDREGDGRQSCPLQPLHQNVHSFIVDNAGAWKDNHLGAFIVPAILSDRRGTDQSVRLFTSIIIDIDSGDTDEKLAYLTERIGKPTMVVASGGHTDQGQLKYHIYYVLDEPTDEVTKTAMLRKVVAQKVGADQSFGRIPQVIRIPGTAHGKSGVDGSCEIIDIDEDIVYSLDFLSERIDDMPYADGEEPQPRLNNLDFTNAADRGDGDAVSALTRSVSEGGEGDLTRWSEFSKVAGHYIHSARGGSISLMEAESNTAGWVAAHMDPPWPDGRVEREFRALVEVDIRNKGPVETSMPSQQNIRENLGQTEASESLLLKYAAHRYLSGPPPPRRFLVDGLIRCAVAHLLVGEAGSGKTYTGLDLALKVSSGRGLWMGQRVTEHATGAVVLLTAEDDKDEIHLRMEEIDPGGEMRKIAGDKLVILPLPSLGGAFPLIELDKQGNPQAHPNWKVLFEEMGKLDGGLSAVVIDTFSATMHGEENSALVVNQWFRVATDVCGAYNAALIITHHVRKVGREGISNASQMLDSVRGSSALPANVRVALGIWHDPAYQAVMTEMKLDPRPGYLYKFAVIKANNPEMLEGEISLTRSSGSGLLVTDDDARSANKHRMSKLYAWMIFTIIRAAAVRYPYTASNANGVFQRKGEFHPEIQTEMTARKVTHVIKDLLRNKVLERSSVLGMLDQPDGFWIHTGTKEDKATDGTFKVDYSQWKFDEKSGRIVSNSDVTEA